MRITSSKLPASLRPARLRRPLAAGAVAVAMAVGLGACGSADNPETTGTYAGEGGAGAPYLNVGPLVYQVQISRALNPLEAEDAEYLEGLTEEQRQLKPGEEWFAVFIQVYNTHNASHIDASKIRIFDTEGHVYYPVVPRKSNLFAYRPGTVPGKGQVPAPDTAAYDDSPKAAMLLFRIKLASLENRPLKITFVSPVDPTDTATADLDS